MRGLLSAAARMLPASALLKRRPRLHLIKLVSAVAALSLVALLYGQHVLRSGAAYNAVAEGGERKMDIVISQESAAASNAGERTRGTFFVISESQFTREFSDPT